MPSSGVGSCGNFVPSFFKDSPYCFPWWLYQFAFPPTVREGSLFSIPSPAFIVCRFFDVDHSEGCEVMPHCSFDLHFPSNEMLSIEIYTLPYVKFGNLLFDTCWSVTA